MPTELELLSTTDAQVWAQEFLRLFGERRDDLDEGLMVSWFANAIETGRSAGHAEIERLRAKLAEYDERIAEFTNGA